ncbi:MAG TPA: hypothetical protein VEX37_10750, partial [Thermomicrobiales bacterium]|nr:hypothetical protein [Thermomicrobiales bacterium]
MIDMEATTIAGMTVIVAVIVSFVVEMTRGQDGSPYSMLGALGGVAYLVAGWLGDDLFFGVFGFAVMLAAAAALLLLSRVSETLAGLLD